MSHYCGTATLLSATRTKTRQKVVGFLYSALHLEIGAKLGRGWFWWSQSISTRISALSSGFFRSKSNSCALPGKPWRCQSIQSLFTQMAECDLHWCESTARISTKRQCTKMVCFRGSATTIKWFACRRMGELWKSASVKTERIAFCFWRI